MSSWEDISPAASDDEDHEDDYEGYGPKAYKNDQEALQALVKKQLEEFPRILRELEEKGQKVGHWIWWACPTQMPGSCDPIDSYVAEETAPELFQSKAAVLWRNVLEKLCDLVEEHGIHGRHASLPEDDHGRVHYFLQFWKALPDKPAWMEDVLRRLDQTAWQGSAGRRGDSD